jgi:hypothetical protein
VKEKHNAYADKFPDRAEYLRVTQIRDIIYNDGARFIFRYNNNTLTQDHLNRVNRCVTLRIYGYEHLGGGIFCLLDQNEKMVIVDSARVTQLAQEYRDCLTNKTKSSAIQWAAQKVIEKQLHILLY